MIYDNEVFFKKYKELRLNDTGLNGKMEEPAIREMIGHVKGLSVLDIGCGFGHQCSWLKKNGAEKVVGIDPSEKMHQYVKREFYNSGINFIKGYYEELVLNKKFDLIVSSMALHYVADLKLFFQKCFSDLNPGGRLVFSIEHPICTAFPEGYSQDKEGKFWKLKNYFDEGIRRQFWFVDGVEKYHRKVSTIMMDLINSGFKITQMQEPNPVDKEYTKNEKEDDYFWIRPSIMVIEARKCYDSNHLSK